MHSAKFVPKLPNSTAPTIMLSSLLLWSLYSAIVLSLPQCDRTKSMGWATSSECQTRCFAAQPREWMCPAPFKWKIREEKCAIGTSADGIKCICSRDRPARDRSAAAGTKGKLTKTETTTGEFLKPKKHKKKKKSMSKKKSKEIPKKKVISSSEAAGGAKKVIYVWHVKSSSEVSGGAISEAAGGAKKISEVEVPLCGHTNDKDKMCRISCRLSKDSGVDIINKCERYKPFIVFTRTLCEDERNFEYLCFKKVPEIPQKVIPKDVKEYHLEGFVNQKTGTVNYNNNQHLIDIEHITLPEIAAAYKRFEALPADGAYTIEQAIWTQKERNARIQTATPADLKNHKFGENFHLKEDSSYDFIVMQSDKNIMRFFHEDTGSKMTYPGPPPAGHSTLLTDDERIRYQAGEKIVHFAGSFNTEFHSVNLAVWSTKSGHFFPRDKDADVFADKWGLSGIMFSPADDSAFLDDMLGSFDFSSRFGKRPSIDSLHSDDSLGSLWGRQSSGSGGSFGSFGSLPMIGGMDSQSSSGSSGSGSPAEHHRSVRSDDSLPSLPMIGAMSQSSSGSSGGSVSSAKQLPFNNIYAYNSVGEPERFYDGEKTLNAYIANINWMIFVIGAIIFIILTLVCCCLYVILSVLLGIIGYTMAKYTWESVNKEEAINYESAV